MDNNNNNNNNNEQKTNGQWPGILLMRQLIDIVYVFNEIRRSRHVPNLVGTKYIVLL